MHRFKDLVLVGDGSFGTVSRATVIETGETVAIKKMKHRFPNWQECIELREVKSLKALNHPNVIKLREVLREQDILYMVFEFCDKNIFQLAKANNGPFREEQVRLIAYQVLNGLSYAHRHGFFHRDLKPENLLCNGLDHVKIADFGLAREIRSRPPYTEYVSTRWYRAPEIVLRAQNYNSPVDIWATACILVELLVGQPLFPATSELDLLQRHATCLGAPTPQQWAEGSQLIVKNSIRLPVGPPAQPLKEILQGTSPACQNLIASLLHWDPSKRPTAESALQHPFFSGGVGAAAGSSSVSGTKFGDNATPAQMASPVTQSATLGVQLGGCTGGYSGPPSVPVSGRVGAGNGVSGNGNGYAGPPKAGTYAGPPPPTTPPTGTAGAVSSSQSSPNPPFLKRTSSTGNTNGSTGPPPLPPGVGGAGAGAGSAPIAVPKLASGGSRVGSSCDSTGSSRGPAKPNPYTNFPFASDQ